MFSGRTARDHSHEIGHEDFEWKNEELILNTNGLTSDHFLVQLIQMA